MNKKGNVWKAISIILAILLVFIIISAVYFYQIIFGSTNFKKDPLQKPSFANNNQEPISEITKNNPLEKNHIDYLLHNLEAYKLHNPPFSSKYPIIELNIEGEIYTTNIINGEIITEKKEATEKDIIIHMDKKTVFEAIIAKNMLEKIRSAQKKGELKVELVANKKELALKGYYPLYEKIVKDEGVLLSPLTKDPKNNYIIISSIIILGVLAVAITIYFKSKKSKRKRIISN